MTTTAAPVLNALSVDVEDYYQVSAFARMVTPEMWPDFAPRVARNTFRLLELFDLAGVRGTFFVLGWVAERNPGLVEAIHEAGHEVASHGWSHRLIYRQTPAEFREETRRSKSLLEDIIGAPVFGYRGASFSIVPASRWALAILAEEGFAYDSSIYPVRHDRYGMPGSPLLPHTLSTPGGELIEFPPTALELGRWRMPVGGGGYFRLYPYWLTRAALRECNRRGQSGMSYLHPWEIDPDQPRIRAGWMSRFRHYVNLHRTEDRLRALLHDFRFAPVRAVLQQQGLRGGAATRGTEAAA